MSEETGIKSQIVHLQSPCPAASWIYKRNNHGTWATVLWGGELNQGWENGGEGQFMKKPGNQAESAIAYQDGAVHSPFAGGNSVWANPGQTSNMSLVPNNTPSGNSRTDRGLVFLRIMKKLRQHLQLEKVGHQGSLVIGPLSGSGSSSPPISGFNSTHQLDNARWMCSSGSNTSFLTNWTLK